MVAHINGLVSSPLEQDSSRSVGGPMPPPLNFSRSRGCCQCLARCSGWSLGKAAALSPELFGSCCDVSSPELKICWNGELSGC